MAAVGATGCGKPIEGTCLRVPIPVLISRVDRIGGHVAAEPPEGPKYGATVEDTITASSSSDGRGNTYTSTSRIKEGSNKMSGAVLIGTQARKDQDFHVTNLRAGSYLFWLIATMQSSQWVGIEGQPVGVSK